MQYWPLVYVLQFESSFTFLFTVILVHIVWSAGISICTCSIPHDGSLPKHVGSLINPCLTLYLLMWRIQWAPNNANKWQMGFNWVFKGLIVFCVGRLQCYTYIHDHSMLQNILHVKNGIILQVAAGYLNKNDCELIFQMQSVWLIN
jgi:hypothetical protein